MKGLELIPEFDDLRPGDHLCLLYRSGEEMREVVSAYLHTGLEREEKVMFVGDPAWERTLCEDLAGAGWDVEVLKESGRLAFTSSDDVYTPSGSFHPRATLDFWKKEVENLSRGEWKALRVAGDMSWALKSPGDMEALAAYEAEVNRLPGGEDCVLLCCYDARSFPPEVLLDMLRTHAKVAVGGELLENVYYVPPGEFLGNMVPGAVLEEHLSLLRERKRAVQEIQRAREYAEAVVDTVREPLLVLDADLRVVSANRSFYRLFRVSPGETVGRLLYELGDRQWDIPALRRLLEEIIPLNTSLEDYAVEHDFPRIGRRTMLLNARRIHGDDDRTRLILLAVEDVTERRAAEEELRRRERYFHRLVENAFDAVTVLDAEGRHLYASPSVERVLGWRPEELLGKPAFEFMHPDDLQEVAREFREGLENPGREKRVTHRWRDREGKWHIVESSGVSLLDDPDVRGVVINCRDITEKRLAEERLHRLNEMFLSLKADFFSNMETVIRACRDILEGEAAVYARPEGEKLAMLTTLPGEEGFLLLEDRESFAGRALLGGGHPGVLLLGEERGPDLERDRLAAAHGYRFLAGCPVIPGSAVTGALCVYYRSPRVMRRDDLETLAILARALAIEEERLARERNLKDFIDVASHELRHPVTIIKGFALTFRDRLKGSLGKGEEDILTAIDEGCDRLVRLVESLLDISRIERGQLEVNPRRAEALPLLRRAVDEAGALGRRVILRTMGKPGTCLLDPDRFLEVIHILLDNALKFSPPGSDVEVEVERAGDECVFSVMDRGPGITEEHRELIFDRFYQVEQARFHSKPGMGMGLYIAREIVERHGGKIWYEAREGGGSVFRFTLPG